MIARTWCALWGVVAGVFLVLAFLAMTIGAGTKRAAAFADKLSKGLDS